VLLGYEISPEQLKRLEKKIFTGLELRPMIKSNRRKKMEVENLRKQQANLLEPAIGTAKKGSPRKAVRQLNKQYEEKLKKMLSYAYWDTKRSEARRKVKKGKKVARRKRKTVVYNLTRQGERRGDMLTRLQRVFGFGLIKKKQKRRRK